MPCFGIRFKESDVWDAKDFQYRHRTKDCDDNKQIVEHCDLNLLFVGRSYRIADPTLNLLLWQFLKFRSAERFPEYYNRDRTS